MNRTLNKLKIVFVIALMALSSCGGDDTIAPPTAAFTFAVDATNTLKVTFTNSTQNGKTYLWNFGDGTGTSTDASPSYTYAESGTYTVTLTATNEGGTNQTTKTITVEGEPAQLIVNGGFDDNSGWTIISHNSSGNGLLTIGGGVATYNEAIDVPNDAWGSEAHMGMYQKVEVKGGNYQIDLDVTINGFDEVWFEVWVGKTEPVEGSDYNTPAVKVLAANSWDCKETQGNYSGSLAANYWDNKPDDGIMNGKITLEAGTYYIDIRSGGFNFGPNGIVVDNVSMVKVN